MIHGVEPMPDVIALVKANDRRTAGAMSRFLWMTVFEDQLVVLHDEGRRDA
jgi:hypothetical protein